MYLDSAILVKLVVREPDSLFYAERLDGQRGLCSSELALTECFSALLWKEKHKALDEETRRASWKRIEGWVRREVLQLCPVDRDVLRRANRLLERCFPRIALRSLDAIHLATCERLDAFPLWSNDRRVRQAAALLRFPLGPTAET